MTEATGNESSEVVGTPWTKKWNEPLKEETTATAVSPAPVEAKGAEGPWERMWGSNKPPAPKTIKDKPTPTDGNWQAINQKYKEGQSGRDASRLEILHQELAKETDPKNIAALKRDIARGGANWK